MAETMKGLAPIALSASTTVRSITGIPVIPLLPAVTATDMPGRMEDLSLRLLYP